MLQLLLGLGYTIIVLSAAKHYTSTKHSTKYRGRRIMSTGGSSNVITCKGVVCWGPGEAPKIEEIEVEPPRSGEIRVQMLFASLCHTDVLCYKGLLTPLLFPRVLGHEGVGKIESVGGGVSQLKVGDLVIPTFLGECRECNNCISGRTNLCQTYPIQASTGLMLDGTSRMSITTSGGYQKLYQLFSCSTWSQYTVIDANYVLKIDSRLALPHASLLSCGFTTGFGATWKEAKVEKGSTVAVFGLGTVGLGAVQGARVHGAAQIIGIDINKNKREKGEAFGMTHYINPKAIGDKSISEMVKELTNGRGVDYSFECTGVPDLVNEALETTKVGVGKLIMIGAGTQKSIQINLVSLCKCRTIKYTVFGGIKVQSDLPVMIDKCINKEIQKLDLLLTHEVQLKDINRAFDLLKEPDCVKILIQL